MGEETPEFQQNSKEPSLSRGTSSGRLTPPLPEATSHGWTVPGGRDLQGHCWFCRRFAGWSRAWAEAIEWPKSALPPTHSVAQGEARRPRRQSQLATWTARCQTLRLVPVPYSSRPPEMSGLAPPRSADQEARDEGGAPVGSVPTGSDPGGFCAASLTWFNLVRVRGHRAVSIHIQVIGAS